MRPVLRIAIGGVLPCTRTAHAAGNGTPRAQASVGIHSTPDAYYNLGYLLPLDVAQRNQIAEIHSAIAALKVARAIIKERWEDLPPEDGHVYTVLLVMDSSYVVRAMTEWIRKWRANGFGNTRGERVANMEALVTLDNQIRELFEKHLVIVRFCTFLVFTMLVRIGWQQKHSVEIPSVITWTLTWTKWQKDSPSSGRVSELIRRLPGIAFAKDTTINIRNSFIEDGSEGF